MNKNIVSYPAVFDDSENGEKGWYTVEFPDVQGAFTDGHGLKKARVNAEQCLGLALGDMSIDKLPEATDIEIVRNYCKKHYPKAHVEMISCDLDETWREIKFTK